MPFRHSKINHQHESRGGRQHGNMTEATAPSHIKNNTSMGVKTYEYYKDSVATLLPTSTRTTNRETNADGAEETK